jgi:GNAT superfamily N-acetyltransferase
MLTLPLNKRHDRNGFDCGDDGLNKWFANVARQHKDKGVSKTFVAVNEESSLEVFGYYAINIAELVNTELPPEYQKRMPHKVPVFRLGRLAIAKSQQGRGIGEYLLFDAIDRVTRIAQEIGGMGLVVNAKASAIGFYKHYDFEQMPEHEQNLFLPIS